MDTKSNKSHIDVQVTELRNEVRLLKEIIALIPGNIYWKDLTGKYQGCNNNVAQILGLSSPDDIVGKNNDELFNKELAMLTDEIDEQVIQLEKEQYTEEVGLTIDKKPAIYLTKKVPLFDHFHKIKGLLGVSFDITERKQMEQDLKIAKEKAETSNQAKSQFFAIVNHELRTPLASILGLIDFLKDDSLPNSEKENIIEAIQNCAHHLLSLVNDILDLSALENNSKLSVTPLHIRELVETIITLLKPLADKKGLYLTYEFSSDLPNEVLADIRILKQILINLISNAIKFTMKGGVTLRCLSTPVSSDHNKINVVFSVQDTGPGIPANKFDLIFEPFKQLQEDAYIRNASQKGTGLGLTIVKKLAESINANIKVESTVGEGSVFSIMGTFTIAGDINKSHTPAEAKQHYKIYPNLLSAQPCVLLVEDDPIIQFIHQKMLADLGCKTLLAKSGKEALALFKKQDIVLVDISLPDINGFEVIRSMRQINNNIPIIALTVFTGENEKNASLNAGANEFASKPISQNNLYKLLTHYLHKNSADA